MIGVVHHAGRPKATNEQPPCCTLPMPWPELRRVEEAVLVIEVLPIGRLSAMPPKSRYEPGELLAKVKKLRWLPVRHWFDLRQLMRLSVHVRDPADGKRYRFVCSSLPSYQRAKDLLDKEPDTIAWLRKNLRSSDVFLDIGANIGMFSIFAAGRLGEHGHVYACEPHLPTAVQLLQNVALNGLEGRISVLSVAASGEDGLHPFRYKQWREGASGSQLITAGGPGLASSIGVELKFGMRVDTMIAQGGIRTPDLIKIDTDGLELAITSGMKALLTGQNRPRSVLVEVQVGELQAQKAFMGSCGYTFIAPQFAGRWKSRMEQGWSLDEMAFNALFEPSR
jgi:FkbM family methyltransferase